MKHRNPPFLRPLLLLIMAVGPLQAQSVLACAMMDTVVRHDCCCDDHKTDNHCTDPDCESTFETAHDPCCERSVEVGIDQESAQNIPLVKLTESGVDPPQSLVSSLDAQCPIHPRLIHGDYRYLPVAGQSGSETYLVTQRLRI